MTSLTVVDASQILWVMPKDGRVRLFRSEVVVRDSLGELDGLGEAANKATGKAQVE